MPNIRGIGRLDDSEFAVYRLMREMGIKPPKEKVHQLTSRLEGLEYGAMKKDDKYDGTPPFVDTVRDATAGVASLPRDPLLAYRKYMTRYVVDGSVAMKYFYLLNAYHDLAGQLESGDPEIASKARRIIEYLEGRAFDLEHLTGLLILMNLTRHGDVFYSSVGKVLLSGMSFFNISWWYRRTDPPSPRAIYGFDKYLFADLLSSRLWKDYWPHANMAQMAEFPAAELSAARLRGATPEERDRYMRVGRVNDGLPYWTICWKSENIIGEDEEAPVLARLPKHELSPLMLQAMLNAHNWHPLRMREMNRRDDAAWAGLLARQQAELRIAELEDGVPESQPGELQQLREYLQRQGGSNDGNGGTQGSSTPASRISRSRHVQDARAHAPSRFRRPARATHAFMRGARTFSRVRA